MATLADLQFEVERGAKIFKSTTTLPDSSQLGFDGDPNAANTSTAGQNLLYNSPLGTTFVQQNGTKWFKRSSTAGGSWVLEGAGGGGTGNVGGITYLSGSEELDGSWRVRIDDADAYNLERREEGTWLVKTLIENSVHTEHFYTTTPIGGLYFNDGHDRSNMISSGAVNHHDTNVGNPEGTTTLIGKYNDRPTIITALAEPYWLVDQFDGQDTYTSDNWGVDFQNFATAMFTNLRVYLSEIPSQDTYARVVLTDGITGDIVSESSDKYLFGRSPEEYGYKIDSKVMEIAYINTIIAEVDENIRIEVTTSSPVTFIGVWAVPEGTSPNLPHNGGYFLAHGSSKGMPFGQKEIATVNDIAESDYAEREAERAFTLHDDVLGGLADQDGGFISFNHVDSHAFQQHTSADYIWAKHYGEFGQQNPIRTLHLHGNDSMLAIMNGDCLSFEPADVLDTLSVSFTGNPSIDWTGGSQGIASVLPNLIFNFRQFFTNISAKMDAVVTIPSRDNQVVFSFTGTEYENTQTALPLTVQIAPINGATKFSSVSRPPLHFDFTFTSRNGQSITHEYTLSPPPVPDNRTAISVTSVSLTNTDLGEASTLLQYDASTVISGTVNWSGSVIAKVDIFYRKKGAGASIATLGSIKVSSGEYVVSGYYFVLNDLTPSTDYAIEVVVTTSQDFVAKYDAGVMSTKPRNINYLDYYPNWVTHGPLYVRSEGSTISIIRGWVIDPNQVGMPEGDTRVLTPQYNLTVADHVDNFFVHWRGNNTGLLPYGHWYADNTTETMRWKVANSGVLNTLSANRIAPHIDYRIHFSRSPVATGAGNPDNWDASYSYMMA